MVAASKPVKLRADEPRATELDNRLRGLRRNDTNDQILLVEFLMLVRQMEGKGFPPRDCSDVLAKRYALYALSLGTTGQYLLCDLDVKGNTWTILAITKGSNIADELYQQALAAHGLSNPDRDYDVQRYLR